MPASWTTVLRSVHGWSSRCGPRSERTASAFFSSGWRRACKALPVVQEELEQAKKAVWTRGAASLNDINVDMNLMELANTVKDCYACPAADRKIKLQLRECLVLNIGIAAPMAQ